MAQATLSDAEIIETVEAVRLAGNITEAAIKLGMPRGTVSNRMLMAKIRGLTGDNPVRHLQTANIHDSRIENNCSKIENSKPITHCLIPDVQAKPGVPLDHLRWGGEYIAEKRPDVIVCIGDFADMESLSSYDRGKKSAENKRYHADLEAAHKAMELLMTPIVQKMQKIPQWKPRLVLTLGNHEDRITRFVDDNAVMEGALCLDDLGYKAWGWEVIPFREPVCIDGLWYCHYFYNQNSGKPYAGENLQTRLKTIGHSFSMGHQQGLQTAIRDLSNGTRQRGLVAGSFYQHAEEYKGPQANGHWHGIVMKHEVKDGNYDLMEVSLEYLRRRYA